MLLYKRYFFKYWYSSIREPYAEYYKSIYPTMESLQLQSVLEVMENLRRVNRIDGPAWFKFEQAFFTNISRVSRDELVGISKLYLYQQNKFSNLATPKFHFLFEQQIIKKIPTLSFNDIQLILIYSLNQKRKISPRLIMLLMQSKEIDLNPLLSLKSLSLLLENGGDLELSFQYLQYIYKSIDIAKLNSSELILYMHVYSDRALLEFYNRVRARKQITMNVQQIVNGYSSHDQDKAFENFLDQNHYQQILQRLLQLLATPSFQNLLLSVKFLSIYDQQTIPDEIFTQIEQNILFLTPSEAIQLIGNHGFSSAMQRSQILQQLEQYFLKNSNEFTLSQSIQILSFKNIESLQRIIIQQLIDKISLDALDGRIIYTLSSIIHNLLEDNNDDNSDYYNLLKNCLSKTNELGLAYIKITHQIPMNMGIQLIEWQLLESGCVDQIVGKIKFNGSDDVGRFLSYIRNLMNKGSISLEQHTQFIQSINSRFRQLPL